MSEDGSQTSGSYTAGSMDVSAQEAMWKTFGSMVKYGIGISAALAVLATYLVYLSHHS